MAGLSACSTHLLMSTEFRPVPIPLTLEAPPWIRDVQLNINFNVTNFYFFWWGWFIKSNNKTVGRLMFIAISLLNTIELFYALIFHLGFNLVIGHLFHGFVVTVYYSLGG